jgi:hypothetical protein
MSWTYNSTLATDLDRVRFLVGDTDTDDKQLQDGEINYVVGFFGSVYGAAAAICEALAAKYARKCDKSVGDLSLSMSQKSTAYRAMAASLRSQGSVLCTPTAGGISIASKDSESADTDRMTPVFARGQFENAGTTNDSEFASFSGAD